MVGGVFAIAGGVAALSVVASAPVTVPALTIVSTTQMLKSRETGLVSTPKSPPASVSLLVSNVMARSRGQNSGLGVDLGPD